jgi:hypothetical protein
MNPSDVRIGNFVAYPMFGARRIDTGEDIDLIVENSGYPISLDEDWLAALGFKQGQSYEDRNVWYGTGCAFDFSVAFKSAFVKYKKERISNIEDVHQLQNLVRAITGEDLTLNKPLQLIKTL